MRPLIRAFMSNPLHSYYLQQMGIETWHIRQAPNKPTVKLMIVGHAPDANSQTQLFAGRSGGLLSKMLSVIGITADDVAFLPASTANFSNELQQRMKTNPPHMLLAMGHFDVLNTVRGSVSDYHGTPVIESFHPDELLAHPADKKNAYQDLLCVQQILAQV